MYILHFIKYNFKHESAKIKLVYKRLMMISETASVNVKIEKN